MEWFDSMEWIAICARRLRELDSTLTDISSRLAAVHVRESRGSFHPVLAAEMAHGELGKMWPRSPGWPLLQTEPKALL
jgi:hypothetical protein